VKMTGVVLMGGKSSRMGTDKAFLKWDNKPLYLHSAALLNEIFDEVYLSVNDAQIPLLTTDLPVIADSFPATGPVGAMVSCYRHLGTSVFFLSCDLPLITSADVRHLIKKLDETGGCSMYFNESRACYEPVCSAWDLAVLEDLETYFCEGHRSLQQFLKQRAAAKHLPFNTDRLRNINTPDDYEMLSKIFVTVKQS